MPKKSKTKNPSKLKMEAKMNNLINNTIRRRMTGKKLKQGPIIKKKTTKTNSLRTKVLKKVQENVNTMRISAETARRESQERRNELQKFIEAMKEYNNNGVNKGGGAAAKKKTSNSP